MRVEARRFALEYRIAVNLIVFYVQETEYEYEEEKKENKRRRREKKKIPIREIWLFLIIESERDKKNIVGRGD